MKRYAVVFDPRTQLIVSLLAAVAVFFIQLPSIFLLFCFMVVYLLSQGYYRQAFNSGLTWVLVSGIQQVIVYFEVEWLSAFGFLAFLVLRFLPVTMAAGCLSHLSTGKLMAALQKMRVPLHLIIALAVALRFSPVMRNEYHAIQVSAKQRGLALSHPKNWLHPLRLFEVTIVPLLMRSMRIAEELGASAATKGIECPVTKTSVYQIHFNRFDVGVLGVYCAWLGLVLGYGGG